MKKDEELFSDEGKESRQQELEPEKEGAGNEQPAEAAVTRHAATSDPDTEPLSADEDEHEPSLTNGDPVAAEEDDQDFRAVQENQDGGRRRGSRRTSLPWIALSIVLAAALIFVAVKNPFGDRKAVAKVNGEAITQDQLYTAMVKVGGSSTLQQLISDKIINQQAKKAGVTVTDQDVQNEIDHIKKSFPSDDAFQQALAQQGLTLDSLKQQLVSQVKIEKILAPSIKITDADMQKYFNQNKAQFDKPEEVRVSHILLASKDDADAALKQLQGGADFAQVAKDKSQDTGTKDNGGDMGFVTSQDLDPAVADAAFKLKVGQLSNVIATGNGFEIIKVTDHHDAVPAKYADVKDDIHYQMFSDQVNQKFQSWYDKVKSESKIEIYLPQSQDGSSATAAS